MTQDETFQALKKTRLEKLKDLHDAWFNNQELSDNSTLEEFLKSHGWGYDEYWDACWKE
jgi:hypothetical protein